MINEKELIGTLDAIADADEVETAGLVIGAMRRLGRHGHPTSLAILEQVKAEGGPDAELIEGMAQIASVEGVLSGRKDEL